MGARAGDERFFALREVETTVGSAPSNLIVLADRSVSRYHARLTDQGEQVLVEDLGSKNGTRVDGLPVDSGVVSSGAEIRFGKVDLRLEKVDRDDAEIVLAVEQTSVAAQVGDSLRSRAETRFTAMTGLSGVETEALQAVELSLEAAARVVSEAGAGFEFGPSVLHHLVEKLRLHGAALLELSSAEDPVVLAKAGELPLAEFAVLPALEGRLAERQPGQVVFECSAIGGSSSTWVVAGRQGRPSLALVFLGEFEGAEHSRPLLGLVLRILALGLPGSSVDGPVPPSEPAVLRFPPGFVVGSSAAMAALLAEVRALLRDDSPVLITGETGTGKELIARLIHRSSARAAQPFVAVNCAAIPADLLEAEMFGVAPGAATGVRSRPGVLARAGEGILFLDEIGDLALTLQAKLLRALQENEITPVGGRPTSFGARIVAATNRDLQQAMEQGNFRRDLYFRLAACELSLPPLRHRLDDMQSLLVHFLRRFATAEGKHIPGLTRKALMALERWAWPGNIRELEHVARRLVRQAVGGRPIDFGQLEIRFQATPASVERRAEVVPADSDLDLKANTRRLEHTLIRRALEVAAGNRSRAARLLGIARNTLAKKLEEID